MPPDRGAAKKSGAVKQNLSGKESVKSKTELNNTVKEKKVRAEPDSRRNNAKVRDPSETRLKDRSTVLKLSTRKEEDKNQSVKKESSLKHKERSKSIVAEEHKNVERDIRSELKKIKESLARSRKEENLSGKSALTVHRSSRVLTQESRPVRHTKVQARDSEEKSRRHELKDVKYTVAASVKKNTKDQRNPQSKSSVSSVKSVNTVQKKINAAEPSIKRREHSSSINSTEKKQNKEQMRPPRGDKSELRLKEKGEKVNLNRDRTRTRTLSPGEAKIIRSIEDYDKIKIKNEVEKFLNTPSTSTVPEKSLNDILQSSDSALSVEDEYEYEDDFEEYESDFEECTDSEEDSMVSDKSNNSDTESEIAELSPLPQQTHVEEEKKLDSGNYDLATSRRKEKDIQEIKLAVEHENAALSEKRKQLSQCRSGFEDEGFEDDKNEAINKINLKPKQTSFNFINAKKKKLQQQKLAQAKERGEQLMKMIHFDAVSLNLLDVPPVPYEIYMRCYGKCNTVQVYSQTNEDNLTEEVQTEEILMKNKWTQKPVAFQLHKGEDTNRHSMQKLSKDYRGVGDDNEEEEPDEWKKHISVDSEKLSNFIKCAGKIILVLLEDSLMHYNNFQKNKTDIPFSDGFVALDVNSVTALRNSPVTQIKFPLEQCMTLLTVHQTSEKSSTICVWGLLEPSRPQMILACPANVSAACFDCRAQMIFAGSTDGAVCLWDLLEDYVHHTNGMRSATYNTAHILRNEGHQLPVVAIEPFTSKHKTDDISVASEITPRQVCTLDEGGLIVIWTVIQSTQSQQKNMRRSHADLGLAPWGRMKLIPSLSINILENFSILGLNKDVEFSTLAVDAQDHLYIGTKSGIVLHCLKSGAKPQPKNYLPCDEISGYVTSLAICTFGEPFFLVGCSDGSIRVHWCKSEKPVGTVTGDMTALVSVQWQHHSPCSIFTLDAASRICIWDLSRSDVHPIHCVPFARKINDMRLSPSQRFGKQIPTVALAFEEGTVEIHQLKQEYYIKSDHEFTNKANEFLHYAGVL